MMMSILGGCYVTNKLVINRTNLRQPLLHWFSSLKRRYLLFEEQKITLQTLTKITFRGKIIHLNQNGKFNGLFSIFSKIT